MKSFKPEDAVTSYFPEKTHDLFINLEFFENYVEVAISKRGEQHYKELLLSLGKTVFVFNIDSCEFFEREEK